MMLYIYVAGFVLWMVAIWLHGQWTLKEGHSSYDVMPLPLALLMSVHVAHQCTARHHRLWRRCAE